MLNVYEYLDKFKSFFQSEPKVIEPLMYKNQFYPNDFGGYILQDMHNSITYFLIHYLEFDPKWKLWTGYDKEGLESNAFFIPVKFVERAIKEGFSTVLVFIVNNKLKFILPKHLKTFYDNNNIIIDNNYGEMVIPVPLIILSDTLPFSKV